MNNNKNKIDIESQREIDNSPKLSSYQKPFISNNYNYKIENNYYINKMLNPNNKAEVIEHSESNYNNTHQDYKQNFDTINGNYTSHTNNNSVKAIKFNSKLQKEILNNKNFENVNIPLKKSPIKELNIDNNNNNYNQSIYSGGDLLNKFNNSKYEISGIQKAFAINNNLLKTLNPNLNYNLEKVQLHTGDLINPAIQELSNDINELLKDNKSNPGNTKLLHDYSNTDSKAINPGKNSHQKIFNSREMAINNSKSNSLSLSEWNFNTKNILSTEKELYSNYIIDNKSPSNTSCSINTYSKTEYDRLVASKQNAQNERKTPLIPINLKYKNEKYPLDNSLYIEDNSNKQDKIKCDNYNNSNNYFANDNNTNTNSNIINSSTNIANNLRADCNDKKNERQKESFSIQLESPRNSTSNAHNNISALNTYKNELDLNSGKRYLQKNNSLINSSTVINNYNNSICKNFKSRLKTFNLKLNNSVNSTGNGNNNLENNSPLTSKNIKNNSIKNSKNNMCNTKTSENKPSYPTYLSPNQLKNIKYNISNDKKQEFLDTREKDKNSKILVKGPPINIKNASPTHVAKNASITNRSPTNKMSIQYSNISNINNNNYSFNGSAQKNNNNTDNNYSNNNANVNINNNKAQVKEGKKKETLTDDNEINDILKKYSKESSFALSKHNSKNSAQEHPNTEFVSTEHDKNHLVLNEKKLISERINNKYKTSFRNSKDGNNNSANNLFNSYSIRSPSSRAILKAKLNRICEEASEEDDSKNFSENYSFDKSSFSVNYLKTE